MPLPDLTGLYARAAMMRQQEEEQRAQMAQAAQMHELHLEDSRFRNQVIRPLEVREAELDLESRQKQVALKGMEVEAEMAKQRNYQKSLEIATGLRQSFSSLPVNERYWKSKDFTDAAKTHYGISPNEETKRLYMDFAAQEIHYQLLDELPGIPSSMPDDGSLEMAEPGAMDAKPTYRNRIEKLEAIKNRFFDLPELHDEIDSEIQREKARPQYWASDMDLLAPFIPESMKGIVSAAKDGREIPPQVRTMVERAAQYQLEQSLKEPGRQIKPPARPISDTVKLKYLEASPEQKEKMRAFWPELASFGVPESGPVINNPTTAAPANNLPSPLPEPPSIRASDSMGEDTISESSRTALHRLDVIAGLDPNELVKSAQSRLDTAIEDYGRQGRGSYLNTEEGKAAAAVVKELSHARSEWRKKQASDASKTWTEKDYADEYERLFSKPYKMVANIGIFKTLWSKDEWVKLGMEQPRDQKGQTATPAKRIVNKYK